MGIDLLVTLGIAALNNSASLFAIFDKAKSEGRTDLTVAEVAQVRALTVGSIGQLQAFHDSMPS